MCLLVKPFFFMKIPRQLVIIMSEYPYKVIVILDVLK